jgi:hypothetical protein
MQESTLHQLSPYIGKIKSTIAASLLRTFSQPGDLVYDPFSGSGTVPLEAWLAGRRVLANDLSPYAWTLTQAKLFPYPNLRMALSELETVSQRVESLTPTIDLRAVPKYVRAFFHPETLREVVAWAQVLKERKSYFLLGCLLGILHHQRPGFLSFPSSHTVPYLRTRRFPRSRFPALYTYRSVRDRLEAKVQRAMRRAPHLDFTLYRNCVSEDASSFTPHLAVDTIVTSPPYMRQLDYGRDNRLRLWFLGTADWNALDSRVTPGEADFLDLMRRCLALWRDILRPKAYCVLIFGDTWSRIYRMPLPQAVTAIALREVGGYAIHDQCIDSIPDVRRVRRNCRGSRSETIIALKRQ